MARRRGFFTRLLDTVTGWFSSARVERQGDFATSDFTGADADAGSGSGSDWVPEVTGITDTADPPGQSEFPFDFQLSGYLTLDESFNDGYVNLEGELIDLGSIDWANLDYFVIQVQQPGRDPYYVTIDGPFDDYDDFVDSIAEWWEQGS